MVEYIKLARCEEEICSKQRKEIKRAGTPRGILKIYISYIVTYGT